MVPLPVTATSWEYAPGSGVAITRESVRLHTDFHERIVKRGYGWQEAFLRRQISRWTWAWSSIAPVK